jgi:excisionase family DNA binding protein
MTDDTWSDVRFLTVYELALMMRISKMSAYRLVRTGELESIRVGRSYRIPEQAVITYMRDAAFTPAGIASLELRRAPVTAQSDAKRATKTCRPTPGGPTCTSSPERSGG